MDKAYDTAKKNKVRAPISHSWKAADTEGVNCCCGSTHGVPRRGCGMASPTQLRVLSHGFEVRFLMGVCMPCFGACFVT